MPVVPFNRQPQPKVPNPQPEIDDTYLAIAAAGMHEQERLFALNENGTVESNPDEIINSIRRNGEGAVDPNYPPVKELLKKLPPDIEYDPYSGGGPIMRIKKRAQEPLTS